VADRKLFAVALIFLALPLGAKDNKDAGFAGRWVMDSKGSTAPEGLTNLEQRIKVSGSKVTIESKFPEPANGIIPLLYLGVMTTTLTLSTDGADAQNQVGPFQMGSKTTLNGNEMVTDWTAEVKGDQVQGHWTRTLSDDGRQMVLKLQETSTKGQQGQAELHFNRK
jgi:hypothetical protein